MFLPRRLVPYGAASLVLLVLSSVFSAHADTRHELEAAEHRQERTLRLIDETEDSILDLREEMNVLAARIEEAMTEFEHAHEEIVEVRDQLRIERQKLQALQDALNERAAAIFMDGVPSEVQILLDADSVNDMFDRFTYVEAASERDQVIAERVEAQEAVLAAVEAEREEVLRERRHALTSLENDRAKLEDAFAEQKRRLRRLARLRAEAGEALSLVLEKARVELLALGGDGIMGPLYVCPVGDPHAYGDTFGILHVHPDWKHIHKGNDIAAGLNTPVYAPFDGTIETGTEKNAGKYVRLWGEEGYVTMLHLSSFAAWGEVEEGDVVGYVGITGNASSPHVHFEWHPNGGEAVDPYPQLNEVC